MNPTISELREAMNAHDAERMAAQFAPSYRSEQPAHPNRGYGGQAQVAANWGNMFRGVPDLTGDVVAEAEDGDTSWVEWIWHGQDGAAIEEAVRQLAEPAR